MTRDNSTNDGEPDPVPGVPVYIDLVVVLLSMVAWTVGFVANRYGLQAVTELFRLEVWSLPMLAVGAYSVLVAHVGRWLSGMRQKKRWIVGACLVVAIASIYKWCMATLCHWHTPYMPWLLSALVSVATSLLWRMQVVSTAAASRTHAPR